jgi:predicted ester cyclase
MSEDNKAVVRAIEDAWNTGKVDALEDHFAEDFDNSHSAIPELPPGLQGAKMAHQGAMQSFPDRNVEILDMISEGDRVFVRMRVTGTNQGGFPLFQVPPNRNQIDFESWAIYRLRDGKVVQQWGMNDVGKLMMQLGALPPPGK